MTERQEVLDFPEPMEPLGHLDFEANLDEREAVERTELTEPPAPAAEVCPAGEEMTEQTEKMERREREGPMEVPDYLDRTALWEISVCPALTVSRETAVLLDKLADLEPQENLDHLDEMAGTGWTDKREHQA